MENPLDVPNADMVEIRSACQENDGVLEQWTRWKLMKMFMMKTFFIALEYTLLYVYSASDAI